MPSRNQTMMSAKTKKEIKKNILAKKRKIINRKIHVGSGFYLVKIREGHIINYWATSK